MTVLHGLFIWREIEGRDATFLSLDHIPLMLHNPS